jgi:hypothetical protein
VRIEAIPPADVDRWWDFVRPGVEEIKELCREPWRQEYVYARLIGNHATLFLFFTPHPSGFAVCETFTDAGGKYLNIFLLHFIGQADANREELIYWVDSVAKAAGCNRARFVSPRAWAKLLQGAFKEKAVIFEREIR